MKKKKVTFLDALVEANPEKQSRIIEELAKADTKYRLAQIMNDSLADKKVQDELKKQKEWEDEEVRSGRLNRWLLKS